MLKVITTTVALLCAFSANAQERSRHYVILGDFSADNALVDSRYATNIAALLTSEIERYGLNYGDTISLRASITGDYSAKPAEWVRDITLMPRGAKPSLVPGFIAERMADFSSATLPQESVLIWSLEELGRTVDCQKEEVHIFVVSSGWSATELTSSGLTVGGITGTPYADCASLTWLGLGAGGDHSVDYRRGLDQLFTNLSISTGVEHVTIIRD